MLLKQIGWIDVTVIYGHDTISMLAGMMSYFAKSTGKRLWKEYTSWLFGQRAHEYCKRLLNIYMQRGAS